MKRLFILAIVLMFAAPAWADDNKGLISKKSSHSVRATLDRLERILKKKDYKIVVRWNHAGRRGKKDGDGQQQTEVLIFAIPELEAHLLASNQTAGIDLPMKALAWKDATGQVWLTYNDPQYIADRHGISDRPDIVKKMTNGLDKITSAATGK